MTKANAHLVKLSGQGDTIWLLLDDTAAAYLEACCSWTMGAPKPAIPDVLIDRFLEEDAGAEREDAIEALEISGETSTPDNDVALSLPASKFNGDTFYSYDASIANLNAFVAKHDLVLHEAYNGYIY
jgi:hypothetical protein